jgi:hypothetical protein
MLFLVVMNVFPFRIFCHESNRETSKTVSFKDHHSHQTCPFCKIHFCNEFLNDLKIADFIFEKNVDLFSPSVQTTLIAYSKTLKNKGPPNQFM